MLTIGERFDRYTIEALLGAGGMGEVYRAFDPKLERRVALKVLHRDPDADDLQRSRGHAARLLREARAAAALDHPGVVAIYDVGEVGDTTFLAMELIDGRSLRDLIGADVPLPTRLAWLAEIAATLAFAHARGLVHRDIKPENIMVRVDGALKVLDFGIARRTRVAATAVTLPFDPNDRGRLTGDASTIAGTPHYMAPEQMQGLDLDGRADQFAWGVVAHELLTGGAMPWPATDLVGLVAAVTGRDADPMPAVPGLPAHVRDLVQRALQRDPDARFPAMDDLVAALGDGPRAIRRSAPLPPAATRPTDRPPDVFAATLTSVATTTADTHDPEPEPDPKPTAAPARPRRRRLAVGLGLLAALAGGAVLLARDDPPASAARDPAAGPRSIAVIGFRNLSDRDEVGWIATALAEMLTTELAIGEQLRTVPVDDVERMKRELALGPADSLDRAALASVGRRLGTDLVVTGTYLAIGEKVRLDVRLVDVATGEALAALRESDRESELIALIGRTGAALRRSLHADELSPEQVGDLRASVPATPEGARLYATGRAALRAFDATRARDALEQLTAREPQFALGHLALADALTLLGLRDAAAAAAARAMALSAALPLAERLVIEVRHNAETGAWDPAIAAARALHDLHPGDLEHGLRLVEVQYAAGRHRDAIASATELHRLPPPLGDDPRIDLWIAMAYSQLGDPRVAETGAAAQRKAEAVGATTIACRARLLAAWLRFETHDTAAARAMLEPLRREVAALGEPLLEMEVMNALGYVKWQDEDVAGAIAEFEALVARARALGNRATADEAAINLADLLIPIGRLDAASRLLDAADDASPANLLVREVHRGRLALIRGDLADARARLTAARQQSRSMGDDRGDAWTAALLVEVALATGDLAAAAATNRESQATRERLGFTLYAAENLDLAARIALADARADQALIAARAAADRYAAAARRSDEASARATEVLALRAAGEDPAAALALARQRIAGSQQVVPRLRVAIVAALAEPPAAALQALADVAAEADRVDFRLLALDARLAALRVLVAARRADEARAGLAALVADAEKLGYGALVREARALLP